MDADVRRAYAVLELTPPVTADTLRKQYRRLARRWHPDRHAYDPAAQADASDRMRRINDAFRLVASSLASAEPGPQPAKGRAAPRWTGPQRPARGMSREEIEEMVASINQANEWTFWPRVSRQRLYSLAAMAGYFLLTALLPRHAARVAALGVLFAWIPLCIIWMAESAYASFETQTSLRRLGWAFMALPLVLVLLTWLG